MDGDAKLRYFRALVEIGYKEIEVAYPSASKTEFDFVRRLISTPGVVPNDTWIQVMAPAREELIRRTIESVRGANKVIIHIHLSTSDVFREVVFGLTEQDTIDLAVRCTKLIRQLTKNSLDREFARTKWCLLFTPENFQDTSVEFAVEICEAIKAAWQPTEENPIIFNLASTVEVALPNVFADQIELFCDSITERDKVCVSVHAHNDRGCGVAAAELAQLAGADRVEGCLFGNGERTGNVDLVTLALNLYAQGIHPGLDFGDMNEIVALVEELTAIPVHTRAPYSGKYVFCTFTGTHQDAIRKGYRKKERLEKSLGHVLKWDIPYLPMDPADLGRKHEAIIRVNSQSGKSGTAWLVKEVLDIELPRELEVEFTKIVQSHADTSRLEITSEQIETLFRGQYMLSDPVKTKLLSYNVEKTVNGVNGNANQVGTSGLNGQSAHFGRQWQMDNGMPANGMTPNEVEKTRHLNDNITMGQKSINGNHQHGVDRENSHILFSSKATIAIESAQTDIHGIGTDLISSILNATKTIGYEFDLLESTTQLLHDNDPEGNDRNASFIKLGSQHGQTSWGVSIHEDARWSLLEAVSFTPIQLTPGEVPTKFPRF